MSYYAQYYRFAEARRKRRYPNAFVSKLSDADAESAETQVWLEFAAKCGYLHKAITDKLEEDYGHIMGKLVNMVSRPEDWKIRR
jgi:four helix bundle protein